LSDIIEADAQPCFDPECSGLAEPEIDGTHRYLECQECGSTFGYVKIQNPVVVDSCAMGVPEDIRRAASAPMEGAMLDQVRKNAPVFVELGRKPPSDAGS
jgi:hypothetical protein